MQLFSYKTLQGGPPNAVYGVDISPDGKMIAAGSLNKGLYIWDTETGEVRSYPAVHADGVSSVHFSPDGAHILTTSLDKTVKIFSSQSGVAEITLSGHGEAILSGTYLGGSSERFVTTGFDNTVRIWTASGEVRQMGGLTPYTYSVDGSPDGNWITAGSLSGQVITWSQDGTQLHAATEHDEGVYAVAYSKKDPNQFATGGDRDNRRFGRIGDVNDDQTAIAAYIGVISDNGHVHCSPFNGRRRLRMHRHRVGAPPLPIGLRNRVTPPHPE